MLLPKTATKQKFHVAIIQITYTLLSSAHSLLIFRKLKILRLSDIFKLKLLTFVFEASNMITPVCFHNFFTLNSSMHHYKTRQSACGDFYLVRKKTVQYGVKCIKYMGATF